MSAHSNALVLGVPRSVQEIELKKRYSKLIDRLDRSNEFTFLASKLPQLKTKLDAGDYYYYCELDKKQQLLQISWEQLALHLCTLTFDCSDLTMLPLTVRQNIDFEIQKQSQERDELLQKEFSKELESRNGLPMVSGKWRKEPYSTRTYERLTNYVPASLTGALSGMISTNTNDNPKNNSTIEIDLLHSSLEGYLGQPYNYNDGELTEEWMNSFSEVIASDNKEIKTKPTKPRKMKKADIVKGNDVNYFKPSMDDIIKIQLENLLEIMKIQVQDRVCTDNKILTDVKPIGLGDLLKEQPVWGIDCYTRRMIEITIEDNSTLYQDLLKQKEVGADNVGTKTLNYFIDSAVLPSINALPTADAHNMGLVCLYILDNAAVFPAFVISYCKSLQCGIALYGLEAFKIHPKGTGVVVSDIRRTKDSVNENSDLNRFRDGIPPHVVITPYLGELYLPHRWCEKLDVVDQAQKKFSLKPTLPDFYNILLERPRQDARGYGLLYVDASQRANMGSSCSHSCNANCTSNIVSRNGELAIVLTTNRWIYPGEELCMDYYSVTTSEMEWRASICLCGSKNCRGTFLHYATQDDLQQVLHQNCGILWRYATLLRACSFVPFTEDGKHYLTEHGMGQTIFGSSRKRHANTDPEPEKEGSFNDVPDWVLKFASDNLKFIEYERKALPTALMRTNNSSKQLLFGNKSSDGKDQSFTYSFTEADIEARSVMEQRIQSFVSCYSMITRVLCDQPLDSVSSDIFPLKPLAVCTAIVRVWDILKSIPVLLEKYIISFYEGKIKSKNLAKSESDSALNSTAKKPRKSENSSMAVTSLLSNVDAVNATMETKTVVVALRKILDVDSSLLPKGFTSMRKTILEIRTLIDPLIPFGTTEARLQLLSDLLVLWANTSHFSMVQAFSTVHSEPVRVVARELGTNIPRNKIFPPVQTGNLSRSDRNASRQKLCVDDAFVRNVETNDETVDVGVSVAVEIEPRENLSITNPLPTSSILDANEVVYEGSKTYGKYFVFNQLMQWFNAGTDDQVTDTDLFGCVQLPLPSACFGVCSGSRLNQAKDTCKNYSLNCPQRKLLLNLIGNERLQINPWPQALKDCFNGLYGAPEDLPSQYKKQNDDDSDIYCSAVLGSPLLDVSLGQVDALFHTRQDIGCSTKKSLDSNDVAGIFDKLQASQNKLSDVIQENNQYDSILPPELPAEWIQCDSCKKWRRIAWYVNHNLVQNMDVWSCEMNSWDPEKACCSADSDWFDAENENTVNIKGTSSSTAEYDGFSDPSSSTLADYEIGTYRDVYCLRNQIYYEAKIIASKIPNSGKPLLKFHFKGWSGCFDEWICIGSPRIQAHNLFTMHLDPTEKRVAYITKYQSDYQNANGILIPNPDLLEETTKRKKTGTAESSVKKAKKSK